MGRHSAAEGLRGLCHAESCRIRRQVASPRGAEGPLHAEDRHGLSRPGGRVGAWPGGCSARLPGNRACSGDVETGGRRPMSFKPSAWPWMTWLCGRRSWIILSTLSGLREPIKASWSCGPAGYPGPAPCQSRVRGHRWKRLCDAGRRKNHGPAGAGTSHPARPRIGDRRICRGGGNGTDTQNGGSAAMIVPNRRLLVCYGLAIPVLTLSKSPAG